MGVKNFIKKAIPSLRMGQAILGYCDYFSSEIKSLNNRINDLDNKNEYLFWLSQGLIKESDLDTKKRVFLNMPKATGDLRAIQMAENYLLQRIKKHTDELNIEFFLIGGTALGAIRHKGFIPWDDDIDIGMLQKDYYLLKQKIDKEDDLISINRYFTCCGGSLVKAKFKFSDNFFIDIFPFDVIRVSEDRIEEYWGKSKQLSSMCSKAIIQKIEELGLFEYAKKRPIYNNELDEFANGLLKGAQEDLEYYNSNKEFVCQSFLNGHFRDSWGYRNINYVFPLLKSEVVFEGNKYSMINKYMNRLQAIFGEIWELPKAIHPIHNEEFDDNLTSDIEQLKKMGIL